MIVVMVVNHGFENYSTFKRTAGMPMSYSRKHCCLILCFPLAFFFLHVTGTVSPKRRAINVLKFVSLLVEIFPASSLNEKWAVCFHFSTPGKLTCAYSTRSQHKAGYLKDYLKGFFAFVHFTTVLDNPVTQADKM